MVQRNLNILLCVVVLFTFTAGVWANGGDESADSGKTTLEFIQWWEPEMPEGTLASVVEEFEAENPDIDIELVSLPYGDVQDQILIQGAAGTLTELVGVNPNNIRTYNEFGFLLQLDDLLAETGMDPDNYAIKYVDGKTWMMPLTTFLYGLFCNTDILAAAGYDAPPATREEFIEMVAATSDPEAGQFGLSIPLSLANPTGGTNDVLPWAWSAGVFTMDGNEPNFTDPRFVEVFDMFVDFENQGYLAPGTLSKKTQEKIEEFKNSRVAMMISSSAHINMLKSGSDVNFTYGAIPGPADYTGQLASPVAGWELGIASNVSDEERDAAWKFIQFLTSADVNGRIATWANAFPGNKTWQPDYAGSDPNFEAAMEIFTQFSLRAPMVGLTDANELRISLNEELHALLLGEQDSETTAANIDRRWSDLLNE